MVSKFSHFSFETCYCNLFRIQPDRCFITFFLVVVVAKKKELHFVHSFSFSFFFVFFCHFNISGVCVFFCGNATHIHCCTKRLLGKKLSMTIASFFNRKDGDDDYEAKLQFMKQIPKFVAYILH